MTQRDGATTRQKLLRAAMDLFMTMGFRGTTTPVIARRAGVAEGTIYRHFRGKRELYDEVYLATQRWALDLVRDVEQTPAGSARDRLLALGIRLIESATRDPAAARMLISHPEERLLSDRSRAAAAQFRAALEQIIAVGKAAGTVRAGPVELWGAVWLRLVGLALHRVAARDWAPDSTHVHHVLGAAWAAIAGQSDSPIP